MRLKRKGKLHSPLPHSSAALGHLSKSLDQSGYRSLHLGAARPFPDGCRCRATPAIHRMSNLKRIGIICHCFLVLLFCSSLPCLLSSLFRKPRPLFNRIALPFTLTLELVPIRGHVPAWATSSQDRGAVSPDAELNLTFVLSRSTEQQAQFAQLLNDQQNPDSPRYHQWLTPQQVGEQYGPTQHDLDALREWLGSQGLSVKEVAPSGMFVSVSGSASLVAAALATDFHYFEKSGRLRVSATAEPAIPSALVPVITSISGLAEAEINPAHHGEIRPVTANPDASGVDPQDTVSNGNHFITPGDFATIFDLKPVYSAGYNGAGQRVAVIGRSRVAVADISAFESSTGLSTNMPNVVIPTNGVDPGITGDADQGEATLDVERVVGVAPGAQVDLVVSRSLGNNNGIFIAAQQEVQTLRDPVMNISFSNCEAYGGASGLALWDALFWQAASEGISVFVSSGDSGAASCDISGEVAPPTQFLSINEICSSSFATCVGGTEFADFNNPSLYWSTTNGNGLVSAQGYIPEGAWNESTTYQSSLGGYPVWGGGGGASVYVEKPWWQSGTGVPNDHARDVPDVSFPGASHDGYYTCFQVAGGDCGSNYSIFYGTSAAAPSMAGVAAILNQKMGGAQGNLNPLLYRIAASNPNAFHDATPASSRVSSCSLGTPSLCNNSTPSATSLAGGLAGYALTTGYDQVTGLGSLDIANFLAAAASASHPGVAATTLAIRGSATTITDKQTATFTATVSSSTSGIPKGTVQFYANGSALGAAVPVSSGMATAALPFPSAGTYYITANYSGDSNYAASTAPGSTLVVTGLASSTTVTASSTSILVGTTATLSVSVAGSAGSPTPTGIVSFLVLGNNVATVPLVNGRATTPAFNFPTIASYTVTADYLGDSVYSPSNSAPLTLTVTKLQSFVQLSSTGASIGSAGSSVIGVYVGGASGSSGSSAPAATGTVQLYSSRVALGSPLTVTPGSQRLLAAGDLFDGWDLSRHCCLLWVVANWMSSTSKVQQSDCTIAASDTPDDAYDASTFRSSQRAATSNTDTVAVTGSLGSRGQRILTCTVVYNGTGTANDIPQCADEQEQPEALNQAATSFRAQCRSYSIAGGRE